MDMIKLASNFDKNKIGKAIDAFNHRDKDYATWKKIKEDYVDYFISIKEVWDSCENKELTLRQKLYN